MLAAVLFALAQVEAMFDIPGPRGVRLKDAMEFGIPPQCVEGIWAGARNHKGLLRDVIGMNNPGYMVERWEFECEWRTECWNQMDNVLRINQPLYFKLRCLAKVKELIGDDLYERRTMPNPLPTYKSLPTALAGKR